MTSTSGSAAERRGTLILIALVLLPWLTSFGGDFVFDDDRLVRNNELVVSLTPVTKFLESKRPTLDFSLALNRAISGLDTWSYHLFNLLVHLGAVLLLRAWLRALLERLPGLPRGLPGPAGLSFALALLWGVHPLQTETVTYIVQRAEAMATLGYLGALWCWLRARDAERSWTWFLGAGLFAWFGMMSKSIVVTLPVTILLTDFLLRPGGRVIDLKRCAPGWLLVLSSLAFPFLSGLVKGATSGVHGGKAAVGFTLQDFGPLEYLASQAGALWGYLRLIVAPYPLCLDHGRAVTESLGAAALPGLGILTLLGLTVWGLYRRHPAALAGAFFFVVLAPTSSFVPIRDIFVEHRVYLALAGPLVLLLALAARFLTTPKSRRLALGLIWAVFSLLTLLRNLDYRDERGMWEDVVRKAPDNPRGHYTLGVFDTREGRYEESITRAREALRLDPDYTLALVLVSSSKISLGLFEDAEKAAREAIAIDDDLQIAYSNLGDALIRQGRIPEAIEAHRKAVKAKKKFPKPHVDLAGVLLQAGQIDEAAASLDRGFERGAGAMPIAWQIRGVIARRQGRFDEAVAAYRQALAIAPLMTDARLNLSIAHQATGRHGEAREQVRVVLEREPENVRALLAEGALAGLLGDFAGSLQALEKAREIVRRIASGRTPPAGRETELARRRLAALPRHEAVKSGELAGLDGEELALQAEIALGRGADESAIRLGLAALSRDPMLAEDLERALAFRLARAAVAQGRVEVALDLLEADLRRRENQIRKGGAESEAARGALQVWLADLKLAALFDEDSALGAQERRRALRQGIEGLLGRS